MPERVLVVEDDSELRELLEDVLRKATYEVAPYGTAEEALRAVEAGARTDVVITDRVMPGMSGDRLLAELRTKRPELNVIVITAFGSIDSAIALIRGGAFDYVTKPFDNKQILDAVSRALAESEARRALAEATRTGVDRIIQGFLGRSTAVKGLAAFVSRAGQSRHPVLITGETGTGKELVARGIHAAAPRGAFVTINCGALPEHLLESEFFGHEKGSFTGADRSKVGLLQAAHGGTVFLDEIGELPMGLQPKLLRALELGEVRPVGATVSTRLDFRLVCATNRDLEAEISAGRFREDLFWRINVLRIRTPPLREHPEDVPLLAEHFRREGVSDRANGPHGFADDAMAILRAYLWPGNARELRNAVQQAVVLAAGPEIGAHDLPSRVREGGQLESLTAGATRQRLSLKDLERRYILEVLRDVGGNKSKAAEILGVSRRTIHRKLEEYGAEGSP